MMDGFRHIETWIFDMDNTLYDARPHVFVEMHRLMSGFIERTFSLSPNDAAKMREKLYKKHGTTMRGLAVEHDIDPVAFLKETHDIDLAPVPSCKTTQEMLPLLPGRKFVFTNSAGVFAGRMLGHLGVASYLDGVFAIEDATFRPKPDPEAYRAFLEKYRINPKTACMLEDSEENLRIARDLGMTTIWIHGGENPDAILPHVQYRYERLSDWLETMKL